MDIKAILAKLKSLGLTEASAALAGALKAARDICDVAENAKRDFTTEERTQVAEFLDGAKQIKARVKELKGDEAMRQTIEALGEGISADGGNGSGAKGKGPRLSLGQQFVTAEAWLAWLKSVAPSGHIADSRKGLSSPPIGMKGFGLFGQKTLITGLGATSGGAFVSAEATDIYEPLGRVPLNLRDLISVRQTGSDTVEFVRQLTASAAAAPVAEATATAGASGQKPESGMTFERVQETVKTIAVWVPATKRALSDAAQLRGLIDQELREDLAEELENQILNGSGVGENFTGLANTADVLAQPFVTDILVTTRKAITNLLVNGKQIPTGWVLSPQDWETIELLQDLNGVYRWGGPINRGPATLWGVPVAQSFLQPEGTAWLGNFSKAVLWDREEANVSVSDSHADFFIRNMVAILAELRAAFGVIRPTAFVEVDLGAGS